MMDVAPFVKDDRTFLPLIYVAQAMGLTNNNITWDERNQAVTLVKDGKTAKFIIGNNYVYVNGTPVKMDVAPVISNGRTCLPIAIVARTFGSTVTWNEATQTVAIFDAQYLLPTVNVQSDNQEIIDLANTITRGLNNDFQKSKAIHDWIAGNISYDYGAYRTGKYGDYTALGTLHKRSGICYGYANLNAALHRAAGIKAKIVMGIAIWANQGQTWSSVSSTQANHAWNEIYIDGRWVIEDACWDAVWEHKYFDPSAEEFAIDHKKLRDDNA